MGRILVIPMRSKFVTDPDEVDPETFTFLLDPHAMARSKLWKSSIADILFERAGRFAMLNNMPPSTHEWK